MEALYSTEPGLRTPVYVVDEAALVRNLEILQGVQQRTGCHILLAQKAFSMFRVYPLIGQYLAGATASGLFEARLAHEEMPGRENHVFSPAYTPEEMQELVRICDHISFNSLAQLEAHRPVWQAAGVSVGLRVNPEHSTQEGHAIYDPCAPGSRLGIRRCGLPDALPSGVEGLHFHTLCEQDAAPLVETFAAFEQAFGSYLPGLQWLNLGGGHHITRPGYDLEALERLILYVRQARAVQRRPVRHLQDVGHMAGGRSVQDQDRHIGGLHHVQHRCNEGAGVESNGLPRLQIDFHLVLLL